MTSTRPRISLAFSPWTVLVVVALVLLTSFLIGALAASVDVLTIVAIAATLAVLVRPAAVAIGRRLRLGVGISVVLLATLVVGGVVAFGGAVQLRSGGERIANQIENRVDRVDPGSALGRFLAESQMRDRMTAGVRSVPDRIIFGSDDATGGLARLAVVFLAITTAFLFITRGPRTVRGAADLFPDPVQRSRAYEVFRAAILRGGDVTRRLLAVAIGQGAAAAAVAWVVGAPAPIALGIWVGAMTVLPGIGLVLGWVPLVALAFVEGTGWGVLALAVALGASALFAVAYRRWVQRPDAEVGLVLLAIGFTVGYSLAGTPGSVAGTLVAAMTACGLAVLGGLGGLRGLSPPIRPSSPTGDDVVHDRAEVVVQLSMQSSLMAMGVIVVLAALVVFILERPGMALALLIGLVLSLALNPVVDRLQHLVRARSAAVAVVLSALFLAVAAFLAFAVPAAVRQSRVIGDQVPDIVQQLEDAPVIGGLIRDNDVGDKVEQALRQAPDFFAAKAKDFDGIVTSIGDTAILGLLIALFLVAFLIDGHRQLGQVRAAIPVRARSRTDELADLAYRTFGRYFGGKAMLALYDAAWVTSVALIFRVPLAPVIGLWSGLASIIPQVGGFLGGAVLVLFALTRGPLVALACLIIFLVMMTIENNVIMPLVLGRAIDLSPLAATVMLLVGAAVGGFVGALLAAPLAGMVKMAYHELRDPNGRLTEPGTTAAAPATGPSP